MNPLDLTLVLVIAATTVCAAQRKLIGLLVGVGALLLLKPLLLASQLSPFVGLALALAFGLVAGFSSRWLPPQAKLRAPLRTLAGGVGGFVLGCALVLAAVTALPLGRDINDAIIYPPRDVPLSSVLQRSQLVGLGRDILLYPLLDRDGLVSPERRVVLRSLHGLFVARPPWERG